MSNKRPQTSGSRAEADLKTKAERALANAKCPIEKLRLFALSRGASGILGMGRMFRRMDDSGNKVLEFEEFHKGIIETGLKGVSEDDAREMFNHFDKDGGGTVNIDEFLMAIRPPISQTRKNVILEAYKKLDKTGDGVLTIDDLKGVYNVKSNPKYLNGEMTEEQLLGKFLTNFETNGVQNAENQGAGYGDGKVTKDEFIDYYSGISAGIDQDAYFVLMIRSAYNI